MDWKRTLAAASLAALWAVSCSGTEQSGVPRASNTLEVGACAPTCMKPCTDSRECNATANELCCDLGSDGKLCIDAGLCPQLCANDSECRTDVGIACLRASLATETKECIPAQNAMRFCKADGDCSGGDVCCGIYNDAICLPLSLCPLRCETEAECRVDEMCCHSMSLLDRTLKPGGICILASAVACPTPCNGSADCTAGLNNTCCHGICRAMCDEPCNTSSDCNGQVCCKTRAVQSPLLGHTSPPGYQTAAQLTGTGGSPSLEPGCSVTPACGSCTTCYETCFCMYQDTTQCVNLCKSGQPP